MKFLKKKSVFLLIFLILGFITLQIPFNHLLGADVSFTLFDFFAPIAGVFVGAWWGVATVLIVEVTNLLIKQTAFSTGVIIRLFPILFATYFFAKLSQKKLKKSFLLFVPAISIIAFVIHPIGKTVWYFSTLWLIPYLAYFRRNNLYLRSLGATFTAHAVGGAAWIWAFNLPASVWNSLIPIVIQERLFFALGISISYIVVKYSLEFLIAKKILPKISFAYLN